MKRVYKKYLRDLPVGTICMATGYVPKVVNKEENIPYEIIVYFKIFNTNDGRAETRLSAKLIKCAEYMNNWTTGLIEPLNMFRRFYILNDDELEELDRKICLYEI